MLKLLKPRLALFLNTEYIYYKFYLLIKKIHEYEINYICSICGSNYFCW
jgi:hypothetical protein